MYPTLSYFLKDMFGIDVPLPVQTFGLFLLLSFVGAYVTMGWELKRKEGLGLLQANTMKVVVGRKRGWDSYLWSGLLGTVIGGKLLLVIFDYSNFANSPQDYILSFNHDLLGATIGLLIGLGYNYYENSKLGEGTEQEVTMHPQDWMGLFTGWAAVIGLLGAKVFHNLENWSELVEDPMGSIFSLSGLTFYGGLICGGIAVLVLAKRKGFGLFHVMDSAAPGLMLAYGVGRMGCHLSGDGDWGLENIAPKPGWMSSLPDWMWSYNYPHNVVHMGQSIPNCTDQYCTQLVPSVFPTPFYESMMAIGMFIMLWSIRKYIKLPGLIFGIYLFVNGVERFMIEQIRVNTKSEMFGVQFTQAQLISSLLVITGLVFSLWIVLKKNKSISPET